MKANKKELTIEQLERREHKVNKVFYIFGIIEIFCIFIMAILAAVRWIDAKALFVIFIIIMIPILILTLIVTRIGDNIKLKINLKEREQNVTKIKNLIKEGRKGDIKIKNTDFTENLISRAITDIKTIENLEDKMIVEIVLIGGVTIPATLSKKALISLTDKELKDNIIKKLVGSIEIQDNEKDKMTIKIKPPFTGYIYTAEQLTDDDLLKIFEIEK